MSVNLFKNGLLQKIAGAVGDAVPLINNFLTNQEGKGAADANTVYVLKNEIDGLNDSLGNLKFAQDAEGNWGYIPSGADAVIPFKSFSGIDSTHKLTVTSNSVSKSIIDMNGYANAIILDYKNQWNFSSVSNGTVSVNNNMACSAPNGSSAGNAKLLIITNITDDTITINRGGTGTGSNAEPIAYGF